MSILFIPFTFIGVCLGAALFIYLFAKLPIERWVTVDEMQDGEAMVNSMSSSPQDNVSHIESKIQELEQQVSMLRHMLIENQFHHPLRQQRALGERTFQMSPAEKQPQLAMSPGFFDINNTPLVGDVALNQDELLVYKVRDGSIREIYSSGGSYRACTPADKFSMMLPELPELEEKAFDWIDKDEHIH